MEIDNCSIGKYGKKRIVIEYYADFISINEGIYFYSFEKVYQYRDIWDLLPINDFFNDVYLLDLKFIFFFS